MEGRLYAGEDYKKEFDSQDYLKTYYAFDSGTVAENEILKFNLRNLFQTFSSEICVCVCVCITNNVIYQKGIILNHKKDRKKKEEEQVEEKDAGRIKCQIHCHLQSRWQEKEARLRRTVTRLLKCDANQPHPLGPAEVPPADCVLTLLALECACHDVDAYRAAIRNLVSLLKPGGHLVTGVTLGFQGYIVDKKKFFGLHLEKETVEKALQDAGCQVLSCQHSHISYSEGFCISKGMCFAVARKGPSA
uniref:Uncharacterized protein n=1 Tax=Catagonus wagneri TaxID=51154 RepID=A0A8C3W5X4_9CETA